MGFASIRTLISVFIEINPKIDIRSTVLSDAGEKEGGSMAATVVGYLSGFLIYMFIFLYGSQIMMSVMEEKSGRVVELLVSSVKPFQLMLGKPESTKARKFI